MEYYYSASEVNKAIKKIDEDIEHLEAMERQNYRFKASTAENVEDVRPDYDYFKMRAELNKLNAKKRYLKHQINIFNTTTEVEGFDVTIDEVLIWLPYLTNQRDKLWRMMSLPAKTRCNSYCSGMSAIIDYEYLNYSLEDVEADYNAIRDKVTLMQQNLDKVNMEKRIALDFEL